MKSFRVEFIGGLLILAILILSAGLYGVYKFSGIVANLPYVYEYEISHDGLVPSHDLGSYSCPSLWTLGLKKLWRGQGF